MKTAFITLAVIGLVAAQNLNGQPACAAACLKPAILKNCAADDVGCQCGSGKAGIQTDATTCLLACPQSDLATALSVGNALCSSYSATAGAATTGVASKSSTPAATTTPAAPIGTGTASNGTASNGTTALSTSAKPTAASSGAGGASSTKSSSAGAAPTLIASIGGLVALVGGMVAAL